MIRVREYGTSGPLVAVLHGGPGAPGYMAPVARRLGDTFQVLEPFQRGSGEEPLTVDRHVIDLHDVVISQCGENRVALVGHSWGAMLALAYTAEHAERVASVVLIGSGTFSVAARERFRAILDARTDVSLRQRIRALDVECPDPDERLGRRARLTLPLYSYDIGSSDPGFEGCDARAHQETWDDMMRLQEAGVFPQRHQGRGHASAREPCARAPRPSSVRDRDATSSMPEGGHDMTSCDAHDASAASLDRLRRLTPDPDRAERVRARCRTRLGRSRRQTARLTLLTGLAWRLLAPVAVGGFCVLYVVALAITTLRLEGILR